MSLRINELLQAIKTAEVKCVQNTIPVTIQEKEELVKASASLHNAIMHSIPVEKICNSCEHCVFWENKWCCSARDMAPIPFEVQNRVGGCSKWYEKDFIPFAFAFLTIGGMIAKTMLQVWQDSGFGGIL